LLELRRARASAELQNSVLPGVSEPVCGCAGATCALAEK